MGRDNENGWVEAVIAESATWQDADVDQMDLEAGLADVLTSVVAADRVVVPIRRRKVSRRAGTLAVVLTIAASAGTAAAVKSGALTGLFPPPGATENGQTEIVNFAAPDFPAVARDMADQDERAGLTFAPGYNADRAIDRVIEGYQKAAATQGSGGTAEQGIKGRFAYVAACTWQRSWLQAFAQHDTAKEKSDLRGMIAITHVIVSSPGQNGTTITEAVLSGINETKSQHEYIRYMQQGDAARLTLDTVNGCQSGQ
jgi:hypothetical protein